LKKFKYVYGPVPSRRLGRSLGVNPIPFKTCNYSCVYCQLGRTLHLINERKSFFPKDDILEEILESVKIHKGKIDYITFVGEGEPTLNKDLGWLIRKAKDRTNLKIAVITNGALLYREDVKEDLLAADVVLPSLDAGSEETFKKINRPHKDLKINKKKVEIITFNSLTTSLCKEHKANLILRGLRAVSDFEYEFQLAGMNRHLAPELETLFLTPAEKYGFLSSSLIKESSALGGDVSKLVPVHVQNALVGKFRKGK